MKKTAATIDLNAPGQQVEGLLAQAPMAIASAPPKKGTPNQEPELWFLKLLLLKLLAQALVVIALAPVKKGTAKARAGINAPEICVGPHPQCLL